MPLDEQGCEQVALIHTTHIISKEKGHPMGSPFLSIGGGGGNGLRPSLVATFAARRRRWRPKSLPAIL